MGQTKRLVLAIEGVALEAGLHLPQVDFTGAGLSLRRLAGAVDAAREHGFAALSANDHFVFPVPWLDGLTALAAVVERAGPMELATTVALPALRGPAPLAGAIRALAALTGGRVVAGVGPGSSAADHAAVGLPFEQRWRTFDQAVTDLRPLLADIPLWVASWGSAAGLRRVARLGDGWLASAYNTSPAGFAAAVDALHENLRAAGRAGRPFPHALVTMWMWITPDRAEATSMLAERLAPVLRRDPDVLAERLCIGSAQRCVELLSQYLQAGCRRVHFWPLGDERRQVEMLATEVLPHVKW